MCARRAMIRLFDTNSNVLHDAESFCVIIGCGGNGGVSVISSLIAQIIVYHSNAVRKLETIRVAYLKILMSR